MNETFKHLSTGLFGAAGVCGLGAVYLGSATHSGGSNPAFAPLLIAGVVCLFLSVAAHEYAKRAPVARPPVQPPFTGYGHPNVYVTDDPVAENPTGHTVHVVEDYPAYAEPQPAEQEFASEPQAPAAYVPPPAYTRPPESQPQATHDESDSDDEWGEPTYDNAPPQPSSRSGSDDPFGDLL